MNLEKHVKAKITWLPLELSGRKTFPQGKYSTAARFRDLPSGEAWSVNIIAVTEIDTERSGVYDLCFLFGTDAPEHILYSGHAFELFESRKVADGVIL